MAVRHPTVGQQKVCLSMDADRFLSCHQMREEDRSTKMLESRCLKNLINWSAHL